MRNQSIIRLLKGVHSHLQVFFASFFPLLRFTLVVAWKGKCIYYFNEKKIMKKSALKSGKLNLSSSTLAN
jgi:hypothetical protein